MTARLIMFKRDGEKVAHELKLHPKTSTTSVLKLAMDTSAEPMESWLFFFLRDHGAYIETTSPEAVAAALNIPAHEEGIVKVTQ
jgi:hypothetical protein